MNSQSYPDHLKDVHPEEEPTDLSTYGQRKVSSMFAPRVPDPKIVSEARPQSEKNMNDELPALTEDEADDDDDSELVQIHSEEVQITTSPELLGIREERQQSQITSSPDRLQYVLPSKYPMIVVK